MPQQILLIAAKTSSTVGWPGRPMDLDANKENVKGGAALGELYL